MNLSFAQRTISAGLGFTFWGTGVVILRALSGHIFPKDKTTQAIGAWASMPLLNYITLKTIEVAVQPSEPSELYQSLIIGGSVALITDSIAFMYSNVYGEAYSLEKAATVLWGAGTLFMQSLFWYN